MSAHDPRLVLSLRSSASRPADAPQRAAAPSSGQGLGRRAAAPDGARERARPSAASLPVQPARAALPRQSRRALPGVWTAALDTMARPDGVWREGTDPAASRFAAATTPPQPGSSAESAGVRAVSPVWAAAPRPAHASCVDAADRTSSSPHRPQQPAAREAGQALPAEDGREAAGSGAAGPGAALATLLSTAQAERDAALRLAEGAWRRGYEAAEARFAASAAQLRSEMAAVVRRVAAAEAAAAAGSTGVEPAIAPAPAASADGPHAEPSPRDDTPPPRRGEPTAVVPRGSASDPCSESEPTSRRGAGESTGQPAVARPQRARTSGEEAGQPAVARPQRPRTSGEEAGRGLAGPAEHRVAELQRRLAAAEARCAAAEEQAARARAAAAEAVAAARSRAEEDASRHSRALATAAAQAARGAAAAARAEADKRSAAALAKCEQQAAAAAARAEGALAAAADAAAAELAEAREEGRRRAEEAAAAARAEAAKRLRGVQQSHDATLQQLREALIKEAEAAMSEAMLEWQGRLEAAEEAAAVRAAQETARAEAAVRAEEEELRRRAVAEARAEAGEWRRRLEAEAGRRRQLMARLALLQGRIRVIARLRPAVGAAASPPAARVDGESSIRLLLSGLSASAAASTLVEVDEALGPSSSQADVWDCLSPAVAAALDGYSSTIFAYGQTGAVRCRPGLLRGRVRRAARASPPPLPSSLVLSLSLSLSLTHPPSELCLSASWPRAGLAVSPSHSTPPCPSLRARAQGKTYTMLGTPEQPGVAPRAAAALFAEAAGRAAYQRCKVWVSALEVYNERALDLLAPGASPDAEPLRVLESPEPHARVPGLTAVEASGPEAVMAALTTAMRRRAAAPNLLNERSSRSHLVLRIWCEVSATRVPVAGSATGQEQTTRSVLSLVDLAGSERLARSSASAERLREARSIGRSLSALGDVVAAFRSGLSHIPYRNSVLTQVLRDALSGDARVAMIAAVSPDAVDAAETAATLHFVERCRAAALGKPARRVVA